VQINIGHLDGDGVYSNAFTTYALSGAVRQRVRGSCIFFVFVSGWGVVGAKGGLWLAGRAARRRAFAA